MCISDVRLLTLMQLIGYFNFVCYNKLLGDSWSKGGALIARLYIDNALTLLASFLETPTVILNRMAS